MLNLFICVLVLAEGVCLDEDGGVVGNIMFELECLRLKSQSELLILL